MDFKVLILMHLPNFSVVTLLFSINIDIRAAPYNSTTLYDIFNLASA